MRSRIVASALKVPNNLLSLKVVKEHVEPLVQSAVGDFGFGEVEFEKVVLGNAAPRINTVRVHESYLQVINKELPWKIMFLS